MAIRELPDLSPAQVVRLVDALLANADALLMSALKVLDLEHVALAQSLTVLGLEESGKAIAVHERRVQIVHAPEGEPFRCTGLDMLWSSHQKKLDKVYDFLWGEPYWFGSEPSDPDANAAELGTIRAWSRKNDRLKQRGFYVELGKTGEVMAPPDVADEERLRSLIQRVHQIGWQLRLGEHIEGKGQDEQEKSWPGMSREDAERLFRRFEEGSVTEGLINGATQPIEGRPLRNAAYRFNRPGDSQDPFRNVGKPGHEASDRETLALWQRLQDQDPESPED